MKEQIAIIGSGTMGNGIAHVFALHGYSVSLYDIKSEMLEKAKTTIDKNLDRQYSKGIISEIQKNNALNNIHITTDLIQAVSNASLVVEVVPEKMEIKKDVFRTIDLNAPKDTIIASNTSSISITQLAAFTQRPDKVIGMHFMNPVPVMPLVEVIRGWNTSDATANKIHEYCTHIQKTALTVNDYPGFISNRILMPMLNEAICTLYEGVAGVNEIDQIMKLGMAHPMGPLQLADFIGLDVCLYILNVLHTGFGNPKYAPCPLLVNMVHAGQLGIKSGKGFYDYSIDPKNPVVAAAFLK